MHRELGMATITWTNASGGDWLNAQNWLSGTCTGRNGYCRNHPAGKLHHHRGVFAGRVGSVLLDDPNAMLQVQGLTLVNALTLQAGILDFGQGGLSGTVIATGGFLEVGQLANFTNLVWVGDFDLNHGFVIASGLTVEAAGGGAGTIAVNNATLQLAGSVGGGAEPAPSPSPMPHSLPGARLAMSVPSPPLDRAISCRLERFPPGQR